jgi:integrase
MARDGLAQLAAPRVPSCGERAGLTCARPYDLRHSFASLLIAEGRLSIVEIAAQLGHNPTVCLDIYGHVMAERAGGEVASAEDLIRRARRDAVAQLLQSEHG